MTLSRKGVWIISVGILFAILAPIFIFLQFDQSGPNYTQWAGDTFLVLLLVSCALLIWGSWLVLSAKKRSGWWSLFILLMLTGWGEPLGIVIAIIFLLLKE